MAIETYYKIKNKEPLPAETGIKKEWKDFCVELFNNVEKIEKETHIKITQNRNTGQPYEERKMLREKLLKCSEYRNKINNSIKNKNFTNIDYNIINEKGYNYYFKFYEII